MKSPIEPIHVLSLGAGVQSSTAALMFARGEIGPMPTAAIFSDTCAEPSAIYEWLAWLETQLPFPVYRVQKADGLTRNLERSINGGRFAGAPFFAKTATGIGPMRRQCTKEFKIEPIVAKVRELVGLTKGQRGGKTIRAVQYIGISVDEIYRMKPSRTPWIEHRWPLVDQRMSRHDCLRWMEQNGYPQPPRSACVYCPYKSNHEWRLLRKTDPAGWAEACRIDALIRTGVRGVRDPLFVHRQLLPLAEVDLRTDLDQGQGDLFGNECEGLCGN
ncbi:hypothetical protein [Geminisphaera colitermitum]|uniref:hypothetical protein n=1 Tax=Geminisphaera colitermitum TaxID=1148786 RepID=UPI0001964F5C|nr:hypothetical protein [Geminisphaera colitermitum]RRK02847.1 hypothetical protein Ga0100230_004490 [Opitutaceae bacterium TAV3]